LEKKVKPIFESLIGSLAKSKPENTVTNIINKILTIILLYND